MTAGSCTATVGTAGADAYAPRITIIEPDPVPPIGRLDPWLHEAGARVECVRPYTGQPIPTPEQVGDALIVMGGRMSALSGEAYPWVDDIAALIAHTAPTGLPTIGICLGAQIAARALGGATAAPAQGMSEHGVAYLELTEAAHTDPLMQPIVQAVAQACADQDIPTPQVTDMPVLVSHDDAVVTLPPQATLLARNERCPIHAWRLHNLLALQHHPETSPDRVGQWALRDVLQDAGIDTDSLPADLHPASDDAAPEQLAGIDPELWRQARAAYQRDRLAAARIDPALQAFGRSLCERFVQRAREVAAARRA